ncbi:MAG: tyrosine-type recombinase/integrase [Candidatus Riflebacteria bacterium]|nr:tyrosine-type recombinase/integrase [Candidatus Riflebacteria bacterium]
MFFAPFGVLFPKGNEPNDAVDTLVEPDLVVICDKKKIDLYIPVVLAREEINSIFFCLEPPCRLVAKLLYGCGLRLFECLQLRLQDLNFTAGVLTVHDGKGKKDRTVPIPESIVSEIKADIKSLKELHQQDLRLNYSGVFLVNNQ